MCPKIVSIDLLKYNCVLKQKKNNTLMLANIMTATHYSACYLKLSSKARIVYHCTFFIWPLHHNESVTRITPKPPINWLGKRKTGKRHFLL